MSDHLPIISAPPSCTTVIDRATTAAGREFPKYTPLPRDCAVGTTDSPLASHISCASLSRHIAKLANQRQPFDLVQSNRRASSIQSTCLAQEHSGDAHSTHHNTLRFAPRASCRYRSRSVQSALSIRQRSVPPSLTLEYQKYGGHQRGRR
jgi:hypothetical protein